MFNSYILTFFFFLHFNFLFPFKNIWNFDYEQKQWKAQQLNTNYFGCISPIYLICHYD